MIFIVLGFVYIFLFCVRRRSADPNDPNANTSTMPADGGASQIEMEQKVQKGILTAVVKHQLGIKDKPKPAAQTNAKNFQQFVDEDDAGNQV